MARVAIITRTKDRTIMLRRAAESVAAQTFKDFSWIVVNDGGNPGPVDEIAQFFSGVIDDIKVIHNPVNLGMEAASNVGIRASKSEFLVIHDDDDTWQTDFLEKTVSFLSCDIGALFGGVVTQSIRIDEKIVGDKIDFVRKKVWKTDLSPDPKGAIQLAEMAVVNQFAPIAFLYRRSVLDLIGYYDETLPVLGDWDFNLRFLLKCDIGLIPEALANYHHRVSIHSSNGAYGNSVIAGFDRHSIHDARIRNKYLRMASTDETCSALASLLAIGFQQQVSRVNARKLTKLLDATYTPLRKTFDAARNLLGR
jgi:glycosyltransferase involved in cell wall biosynthesis